MNTLKLEVEFRVPSIPKFIKIVGSDTAIDIAQLSKEDLSQIVKCWSSALFAEAEVRRAKPSVPVAQPGAEEK